MNARARGRSMILGSGQFKYRVSAEWAKLPDGWSFKEVAAVGVDSQDRVYAFNRGEHPMMVFVGQKHRVVGRHVDAVGSRILPLAPGAQKIALTVVIQRRSIAIRSLNASTVYTG